MTKWIFNGGRGRAATQSITTKQHSDTNTHTYRHTGQSHLQLKQKEQKFVQVEEWEQEQQEEQEEQGLFPPRRLQIINIRESNSARRAQALIHQLFKMTEDEILFDDVYELCEVIGK